jgi:hypothetical protein
MSLGASTQAGTESDFGQQLESNDFPARILFPHTPRQDVARRSGPPAPARAW